MWAMYHRVLKLGLYLARFRRRRMGIVNRGPSVVKHISEGTPLFFNHHLWRWPWPAISPTERQFVWAVHTSPHSFMTLAQCLHTRARSVADCIKPTSIPPTGLVIILASAQSPVPEILWTDQTYPRASHLPQTSLAHQASQNIFVLSNETVILAYLDSIVQRCLQLKNKVGNSGTFKCACAHTHCVNSPSQPLTGGPGAACATGVPALPALALPTSPYVMNGDGSWQAQLPSRRRCVFAVLYVCVIICLKSAACCLSSLKGRKGLSCLLLSSRGTRQHLADNSCSGLKNFTHLPINYSLYMH